jgi:hypothetical protein
MPPISRLRNPIPCVAVDKVSNNHCGRKIVPDTIGIIVVYLITYNGWNALAIFNSSDSVIVDFIFRYKCLAILV